MKAKPSQLFTFLLGFNLNCREMTLDVRINHAKAGGNFLGCHKQTVSLDITGTWSRVNLDSLSLPGSISSCLPGWRRGGKQTISHFTSVFELSAECGREKTGFKFCLANMERSGPESRFPRTPTACFQVLHNEQGSLSFKKKRLLSLSCFWAPHVMICEEVTKSGGQSHRLGQ